ncbi:MAG: cystathionine beta-lyase [Alphaproteobacteria bacterium]|nr:cystathionine beta-lyase [Alphaproteobacteria bacterium]
MSQSKRFETLLTHAGSKPDEYHGAVNVPPHRMSTIVFRTYAEFEKVPNVPYSYGRAGTPSTAAFEEGIAAIEGAHRSVATCSGLSAILTALMAFTEAGDHILMTDNCYGPSRKSCEEILRRFGVDVEYYPPMMGAEIQKLFRPNTKLVFMEAPGSLTFEVQDIGAITAAAQKAGIKTAIDNSWATPLFFQPLAFGIDVSVMSATKYISGHSDVMLGVVSTNEEAWPQVKRAALMLGLCGGSEELYLGLRGLRTLNVRLQQHQKNALDIATWLSAQPQVKRVHHPALPSCPGHENWKKYYKGSSGTFGIILHQTDREKIAAMLDGMEIFNLGFSWGGFESLLFPEQPKPIRTAETWTEEGFSLRLHIGLEDVEDIRADLKAGLARL